MDRSDGHRWRRVGAHASLYGRLRHRHCMTGGGTVPGLALYGWQIVPAQVRLNIWVAWNRHGVPGLSLLVNYGHGQTEVKLHWTAVPLLA